MWICQQRTARLKATDDVRASLLQTRAFGRGEGASRLTFIGTTEVVPFRKPAHLFRGRFEANAAEVSNSYWPE
jgi:hypothetical protein